MKDYLNIGPTPVEEDCVQVGAENYSELSRKECRRFAELLEDKFVNIPRGDAYITVKSFPHDFGMYREVCVVYDDDDEQGLSFALFVENNTPVNWNDTEPISIADYDKYISESRYAYDE